MAPKKPEETKSREVLKHSAAVQISNGVSLLQRKVWNILLWNAYNNCPGKEVHTISLKEIWKVLEWGSSKNHQRLQDLCEEFTKISVKWNLLGKDRKSIWGVASLLASAEAKEGVLSYAFAYHLRERLLNPYMYARISLSLQNKFDSKHALALYELCVDYFIEKIGKGETPWLSLAEVRSLMGTGDDYPVFYEFKRWALNVALSEINEKSDLDVEIEYKKEQRKVAWIKFRIRAKPNRQQILLLPPEQMDPTPPSIEDLLFDRLREEFKLSQSQAKEVMVQYTVDELEARLEILSEEFEQGKIRNLGAYAYKSLSEGYVQKESPLETKRAAARKAKEEEAARKAEAARQEEEKATLAAGQMRDLAERIALVFEVLKPVRRDALVREAVARLPEDTRAVLEKLSPGILPKPTHPLLLDQMEAVLTEQGYF